MTMNDDLLKRISKHMSWVLRHQADQLGLDIDPEGFVRLEELLTHVRQAIPEATETMVRTVVDTVEPQKQRFSIVDDCIRANYGHSIEPRIAYPAVRPPTVLYHGTSEKTKDNILMEGLRPMNRQFVHLTVDIGLARQVGSRHGKPCVILVDAERAWSDGVAFHHANRGFWLVAALPPQYLSM
jgi:putative RNA 2'-phosphotransferase